MSDNIPFEIQVEIIKRIPDVKSLIRFRSVSKPWKSLIDSSKFIAAYKSTNHHLLVRYDDDHSDVLKYVSIRDNDSFPQHKFPINVPESVKLITKPTSFIYILPEQHIMQITKPKLATPKLVGSSHGLFCFYNFFADNRQDEVNSNTVVVWNPSIRKSLDIAVFDISFGPRKTVIGFGVCPQTLQFKLIKVSFISFPLQIEFTSDIPYQVEVFTGGDWRSPLCSINNWPRLSIELELDQVELDGFLYWHAYDRTPVVFDYRGLIMSFDMTSEEFTEINLPDGLASQDDLCMSKLNESLVVLDCNLVAEKRVFDVWKMEHGISKTFTKLYTISSPEASIERVLGFRKSGEPMIEMRIDSEGGSEQSAIFVYEPDSKRISNVGISGKRGSFFVSSYVETLLLFDH